MKLSRLKLGLLVTTLSLFSQNYTFGDEKVGSKIEHGFYENSKNALITDLINQAKSTLEIEIYEMDDPKVIASIRNAVKRGVMVRIVKEPRPVGSACRVFESEVSDLELSASSSCANQQRLVSEVNQSGGQYLPFTKPALCGGDATHHCLEHGKLLIVDSSVALISSGNFNTTNLCDLDYSPSKCNRDYSYITDDIHTVRSLQKIVESDLIGKPYDVSTRVNSRAREKLTVGPDALNPLLKFIQSAKRSILIENQYLKDPTLNSALITAAKRGINVQIVLASVCSFGRPKENEAKRLTALFKSFDKAGIRIKMFNKNISINGLPGYLHAKAILVDEHRAWMGSVNGSTQALTLNREFGIFFDDPTDVKKLESAILGDFNHPNAETWQSSMDCAEYDLI